MDKMKESLSKITVWAKDHPLLAVGILGGVILLAWWLSRNVGSGGTGPQLGTDESGVNLGGLDALGSVGGAGDSSAVPVSTSSSSNARGSTSSDSGFLKDILPDSPIALEGLQDTGLFDIGATPFDMGVASAPVFTGANVATPPLANFSNATDRKVVSRKVNPLKNKRVATSPTPTTSNPGRYGTDSASITSPSIIQTVANLLKPPRPGVKGGKKATPSTRAPRNSTPSTSPSALFGWFINSAGQRVWVLRSTAQSMNWKPWVGTGTLQPGR